MAARFEVYDESGNVVLSMGNRALRLLTAADVNIRTGSMAVSGLDEGTVVAGAVGTTNGAGDVSVVGGNVQWSGELDAAQRIHVMVY